VLRDKGRRRLRVLTAGGGLELSRRYFWAKGVGGAYPADAVPGVAEGAAVSAGALQILCRMGMVQDFAQAADDAGRIGGVAVSKERLRQLVEAEAEAATEVRRPGAVPAAWSAAATGVAYAGVDGVMAPAVTQAEKDKRRRAQAVRRQQRSASGVGNAKALPAARPGSDEKYKGMKVGVFYDQDKAHRHAFATGGRSGTFAPLLKAFAGQVGFDAARQRVSLTDGAKWIITQVCLALTTLSAMLLDFYHLAQHVHATARCCLGETRAAEEWAHARLAELKERGIAGAAALLAAIDALRKRFRSPAKRDSLRLLRAYVVERMEMLDYRAARASGWDIGSGPTEAMCKTLTLRLKRPGMKWDADHAAGMMNLVALYESGQAKSYWAFRAAHPGAYKAAA
jgi:hypothetical protein